VFGDHASQASMSSIASLWSPQYGTSPSSVRAYRKCEQFPQ
jgi:hypothetical protein